MSINALAIPNSIKEIKVVNNTGECRNKSIAKLPNDPSIFIQDKSIIKFNIWLEYLKML